MARKSTKHICELDLTISVCVEGAMPEIKRPSASHGICNTSVAS